MTLMQTEFLRQSTPTCDGGPKKERQSSSCSKLGLSSSTTIWAETDTDQLVSVSSVLVGLRTQLPTLDGLRSMRHGAHPFTAEGRCDDDRRNAGRLPAQLQRQRSVREEDQP